MKNLLFFALLAFLSVSCEKISPPENKPGPDTLLKFDEAEQIAANNAFSFELFKQTVSGEIKPNTIISPLSVTTALYMAYNGSNGETREQMASVLHLAENTDTAKLNAYYKQLLVRLSSADPKTTLNIANSLWMHNNFPVWPAFVETIKTSYDGEVSTLDFTDPQTLVTINQWVSNKTEGKITKILDEISPDEKVFLINALYFNAIWKKAFDVKNTTPGTFNSSEGPLSNILYLNSKDTFNYFENEQMQLVELPYGNGLYSMMIALPKTNKTLESLVNELNPTDWESWVDNMRSLKVHLSLPKFKLEYEIELNEVLKTLGMPIAFTDKADFSNISIYPLAISKVIHKTYIDVNEAGTEAAAVTSIGFEVTSMPIELEPVFRADKPFVFVICEKQTGAILFMGKVGKPEYQ